jgi:hypothetical protein
MCCPISGSAADGKRLVVIAIVAILAPHLNSTVAAQVHPLIRAALAHDAVDPGGAIVTHLQGSLAMLPPAPQHEQSRIGRCGHWVSSSGYPKGLPSLV